MLINTACIFNLILYVKSGNIVYGTYNAYDKLDDVVVIGVELFISPLEICISLVRH